MATPFQTEAWTEYALGVIVLLLRIFARFKTVGLRGWKGDDYFTIISLLFWTAELTMLELIGQFGTNIGWTDEQRAAFSEDQIKRLSIGSQCLMAGWICYSTLIWSLKACMLFFYNRITVGLWQHKLVKLAGVLCVCTYISVFLTVLLHCRPLHKHFQVNPDPGDECTKDFVNYIIIAATNVSTDAILVSIPIPLLWRVKITLGRKLIIGLLLCSGLFVMVATLLRCILSLKDVNSINTSTIWAIRETFVAIVAVNAPCIKPLFSTSAWLGSSKGKTGSDNRYAGTGSYGLSAMSRSRNDTQKLASTVKDDQDSEELILSGQDRTGAYGYLNDVGKGNSDAELGHGGPGIQVTTTYEVTKVEHV